MKLYPDAPNIGENDGFTPEADIFDRRNLGSGMTRLIEEAENPLVLAFDGPWGSGKSTFLKMWAGELRKEEHPVIMFDAFENDYIDDAFAAIVRELVLFTQTHD